MQNAAQYEMFFAAWDKPDADLKPVCNICYQTYEGWSFTVTGIGESLFEFLKKYCFEN